MFTIASEVTVENGEMIFREDGLGDCLYQVLSGAVVISGTIGDKTLVMEVLRAGEIFGEDSLLGAGARGASARALGKTVLGVVDTRGMARELAALSPALRTLFESVFARLGRMTETAAGIKTLRRETRVEKVWSLYLDGDGQFKKAFSREVSAQGMFIKTPAPLARGERFDLLLRLPGQTDPLAIRCEVAWNRMETDNPQDFPVGMGVEFVEMSAADTHKLRDALAE
jgi:uncharacterized protein (TIGR02266 family)